MKLRQHRSRRFPATLVTASVFCLASACTDPTSQSEPSPPATIRIETKTPSTLADSDMVVMRASVFDATGALLPGAAITWTSLRPKTVYVSSDGHLYGFINTSGFCCDGANQFGRDAKIVASVSSNPLIADTTIAYVMLYATTLALKPNTPTSKTFPQVATLSIGDSSSLHATGFVPSAASSRFTIYDSLSVDQLMVWTSRSPGIASIDRRGVVTGRSTGNATIVVQARGGLALDSGFVVVR